jgi:hypothetical protein
MKNIFKKYIIPRYFFDPISIKTDFHWYLYDNLKNENYTSVWNLRNALIDNIDSEYI